MLVGLYEEPEKPSNALEFLVKHMQGGHGTARHRASRAAGPAASSGDVAQLREENEALKREVEALKAQVADLQKKSAPPADA